MEESTPISVCVASLLRIKWGISGRITGPDPYGAVTVNSIRPARGVFKLVFTEGKGSSISQSNGTANIYLDSSYRIPDSTEAHPVMINTTCLLRIRWGISGSPGPILSGWSPTKPFWHKSEEWPYIIATTNDPSGFKANKGYYDTSTKVPLAQEIASINQTMQCLLRISWAE